MTLEDVDILVLMQVDQNKSEDFAKVETSDHLLKGLLTWSWRVLVNDDIVWGSRQDLVFVVKSTPLAVDCHWSVSWEIQVVKLWNTAEFFHVGSVATGSEDASNLHGGIGVG